jgi:hypothetical protein
MALFDQQAGEQSRKALVYRLPGMDLLHTWQTYEGNGLPPEAALIWRELGDGGYLLALCVGAHTRRYVVDVRDGQVEQAEVTELELARLLTMASSAHNKPPLL